MKRNDTDEQHTLGGISQGPHPLSINHPAVPAQAPTLEQRVDAIGSYWGRALVDAWRTVFPQGVFRRKGQPR